MATGDQSDIISRLQRLMPPGWFAPGETPIRDALLTGVANALSYVFSLIAYLKLQTRLQTMTDGFLDLFAFDFFGTDLLRNLNQSNASYLARIQAGLFQKKNTRAAIIGVLTQVTGRVPILFEPQRPLDTGVLNNGTFALGAAGGLGSRAYPYQSFVTAFRPHGAGIANVQGLGFGSLNAGTLECVGAAQLGFTDADIYAAVESVRMGATILWVRINS